MSEAQNEQVELAIQTWSSDLTTLADACAAGDASTANSVFDQAKSDGSALLSACKATIASPPAS
ncbi:hypothetical protein P3T35_007860 [Kitasatospora sp. GP30]|nr:hypothetical protein [Kitasatospora sp. GP30]